MQYPGANALQIKQHKNRLCGFGSRHEQNYGLQKTKNHATTVIFRPCSQTVGIILNFGLWGDIIVSTHAKFCVVWLRGFGVLTRPIFLFSIGLAGRPYNSASTTVLHCDVDWQLHNCLTGDVACAWRCVLLSNYFDLVFC